MQITRRFSALAFVVVASSAALAFPTRIDRVVVSGILRAIPGQKVDPQAAPEKTAVR